MRFLLCIIISVGIFNLNLVNAQESQMITDILPKVASTPSTYAPITGKLDSNIINKTISIRVGKFNNNMESVNLGLYVDGEFQGSEEKILSGGTADFKFPSAGESYEIHMSTYSSDCGTCEYSISID